MDNVNIKINRYCFQIFTLSLIIFLICLLFETNIINFIKELYINRNYYNEMLIKYNTDSIIKLILSSFFSEIYNNGFCYNIIWGTNVYQIFIPFIAVGSIMFFRENNCTKNVKTFFIFSLKISLSIFMSFVLYYILIFFLSNNITKNIQGELFLDILGNNFYYNHFYLYYFIDGCIRFILMPFIYSFSGLLVSKNYKNILNLNYMIILLYFGLSSIMTIFEYMFSINFLYLNPSSIMYSNIYNNINTILILASNLSIIIISFIYYKLCRKKYELTNITCIITTVIILFLNYMFIFLCDKSTDFSIIFNNISYFIIYMNLVIFITHIYYIKNRHINLKKNLLSCVRNNFIITLVLFFIILLVFLIINKHFEITAIIMSFLNFYLFYLFISIIYISICKRKMIKKCSSTTYKIMIVFITIYSLNLLYEYNYKLNIIKHYIYYYKDFSQSIIVYLIIIIFTYILILILDCKKGVCKNDSTK